MDVDFEHATQVYDFYRTHRQPPLKAKAMYAILAARYRPRVAYAVGARRAMAQIVGRRDVPLLIAANHVRRTDPFVLAAAGFCSPLRPRIGRLRVLAKDELFAEPAQRRKIDDLGGIPVFRQKDHGLRAAAAAGKQMMEVCVGRMSDGDSIAIFPEGTCNEGDPLRLQKVSSGVGHIASGAVRAGANPWLVCAGIVYPDSGGRPTVLFSAPIEVAAEGVDGAAPTPAQLTRLVTAELQEAVTAATR
ncbi:MAG: 1-acyl-sn-glycerol-3-phosphate acyltransferase [Gordonia sp. (in: high G+C Gram-positive bacteria)]|uniref:lysophospholipid acyltransferase family protein n=1 Tax=Gordonia sp. (in: high G+C Gram-positive bacteria) TaxID=84139 RepID=UPI003C7492A3